MSTRRRRYNNASAGKTYAKFEHDKRVYSETDRLDTLITNALEKAKEENLSPGDTLNLINHNVRCNERSLQALSSYRIQQTIQTRFDGRFLADPSAPSLDM